MAGQGRPPERPPRLRGAASVVALVLILCALILCTHSVSAADDVDLRLRTSWGGGTATAWTGSISLSAGSLSVENVLGLEADSAGVAVNEDASTLRIIPRTPRAYDGFDLVVRAPRDAVLRMEFASATNQPSPASFEVPLEQLLAGRFIKQIDDTGNRFAVQRTPGDLLRFETIRQHLVFEGGERLQASLVPHLIDGGKRTTAKCSLKLVSAETRAAAWQKEVDVTLDESGSAAGIPLDIDLPANDGVYELIAELYSKRFGTPLLRGKLLAERQVQVVVVAANRPESVQQDWATVGEFDPAHPKLWDRMLRLPTMKMVPGLSQGPLGNEPTGTREHQNTTWSTLKPNAWQAYPLPVFEIGLPHILEIDFPNDVPQSLAISVIEPNAAGLVMPLGLDSGIDVDLPASRIPATLKHRLVFWPRTRSPLLLLANRRGEGTAIFGKVRVLAGPAQLAAGPLAGNTPERLVAAYFDKPHFPENFSVSDSLDVRSARTIDDWSVFLQGGSRLADYLRWSGHNGAVVGVLCEGSSLYPSEVVRPTAKYDMGAFSSLGNDPLRKDVVELLLRLFDREQLQFIPTLAFNAPLPELEELLATSIPRDSEGIELIGPAGERWIDANPRQRGMAPYYNLLDPRVQQAMRRAVLEVAERYASHRSLRGIALKLSSDGYAQLPDDACGLDDVTLARFATQCRLALPEEDPRRPTLRWDWIQREARPQWLQWRAAQVTSFYRTLAEELQAVHPELQLLLCPTAPLSSRRLAALVRPQLPPQDRVTEGLPQTGIDAEQLRKIPGLTLARSRTVEPSILAGGDPLVAELNASTALDHAAALFASPAALQIAEPLPLRLAAFDKLSPFGSQNTHAFLLSHLSPVADQARKRFIGSLAAADAHTLLDGGQMLSLGQEDAVRELLQTLADIPAKPFVNVPPAAADTRIQPVTLRRWSDETATWFYLLNDSPWPVIVDIDLASSSALALKTLGPNGRHSKLAASSGSAHWKVKLQPYELSAARFAAANLKVENWRTHVDQTVDAALREHIRDIRLRANLLRSPTPLETLANSGFESPGKNGNRVPNWTAASGAGITVELDAQVSKEGGASLHMASRQPSRTDPAPVVWIRSDPIPTPATGRLTMLVWLKTRDARRQPTLRLAIEGNLDGQPYYRRANVGASEDGRKTQPLLQEWSQFQFSIDDLPAQGLTDLQIGFDLMDEGEVWIDEVQVFDLWFSKEEREALLKSILLADFQVQEGKVGDSLHLVESYWPQFLRRNVPLETAHVASVPERPPATPPPAKPAGTFDGLRRWIPRLPFQK